MARKIHVLQPGGFYAATYTKRSKALHTVAAGLAFWLTEHSIQMLRPGEKPPRSAHKCSDQVQGYIPAKMPPRELPGVRFTEPVGFKPTAARRTTVACRDYSLERLPEALSMSPELFLFIQSIIKP